MQTIYDFEVTTISGETTTLKPYQGDVLLIVNVASKCGFTNQYEELERLYRTYKDDGLVILGFPCNQFKNQEPGSEDEILQFCRLTYGVSFPLFAKIEVNGEGAHPLYEFLRNDPGSGLAGEEIKWNFNKFLIDRQGRVTGHYSTRTVPADIESDILELVRS